MLSPRWRKIGRELCQHKARTVLVILSIAVGIFAIGMIAGTQSALVEDLTAAYASTDPASALLSVEPFDEDMVQTIRNLKGVKEAEGRRILNVQVMVGSDQWRTLRLLAIPDFEDIRINKVWSEKGAWPPPDRELLLERSSADFLHAGVGSALAIKLSNGKVRNIKIAGLAHDLDASPSFFSGRAYGYISFDTLEWLGQPRQFSQLRILVSEQAGNKQHIRNVAAEVKDKVEKSGRRVFSTYIPEPLRHPADSETQALLLILGVLGVMALLLSGFLVVNTISALLTQQIRQIGVMKTVGARSGQVMGIYVAVVLVYSVLSLGIGVPLGIIGAYRLTSFATGILNFDTTGLKITPQVLALEAAVGLMVPLLASLYPIISGTRISVREALSFYGLRSSKVRPGLVDRIFDRCLSAILSSPRPLLLSLRNTFRRKGRLALTLTTLILAGTIFIGVFSVHASTVLTLDDALAYWNYDVEVNFSRPYRLEQLSQEALTIPGVTKAESWLASGGRRIRPNGSESESIYIVAPPPQSAMIHPIVIKGRWLLPEDENAVVVNSDLLRNDPDIEVGSDIVLKIGERETAWRVVGTVRGVLSGPAAYVNPTYFAGIVRMVGRASQVLVQTERHDKAFQAEVAAALEERYTEAGLRVSGKETIADVRSQAQAQFDLIIMFLLIMAVLLAIVGGLGLMGTMSINVLERIREIGVMRAIGASDGAVLQIFLLEGILIGLISWLAGAAFSLPFSRVFSDAVGDAFVRSPLSYTFSFGGMLLWLAVVFVLSTLASFLPSWNASRLSVREVLAYE
ncbi:MAG: FtsX-like permease family protein [Chloroflexi bacterium]|nr:FtsX-like permease family protein [Chloroflexota bacterium]